MLPDVPREVVSGLHCKFLLLLRADTKADVLQHLIMLNYELSQVINLPGWVVNLFTQGLSSTRNMPVRGTPWPVFALVPIRKGNALRLDWSITDNV